MNRGNHTHIHLPLPSQPDTGDETRAEVDWCLPFRVSPLRAIMALSEDESRIAGIREAKMAILGILKPEAVTYPSEPRPHRPRPGRADLSIGGENHGF